MISTSLDPTLHLSQTCHSAPRCCVAIRGSSAVIQTVPNPVQPTTDTLDRIFKHISEVKSDLSELKTKLNRITSPIQATSQPGPWPSQNENATTATVTDPKPGKSSEAEHDYENDDSVITIDENTPELSDEQSLNSALTSQLQKLMQ